MVRTLAVRRMSSGKANRILSTRCHLAARIDTLLLQAGPVVRTLSVKVTLDSATLHKRIALQPRQTATRRSMLVSEALRVQRTWILQRARVQALAVVALLVVGTLAVRLATQLEASKLRVSRVARLAAAHRVVVLHVAIGVLAAVARIGADLVDAGLTGGAVRVGATLGQVGNRWRKRKRLAYGISQPQELLLTWYAVVVGVLLVSSWAVAHGIVQQHVTNGSSSADVLRARVDATLVQTGSVQRAVVVHGTFLRARYSSLRCTLDVWISYVFRGTRTLGPMSAGYALCVHSAWFGAASQHTLSSHAAIGVWAIVVLATSFYHNRFTLTVCVDQHVGWTSADHRPQW